MRVLITGATGYLGTAMQERVPAGIDVIPVGHSRGGRTLDILDAEAVTDALRQHRPDVVVHLAAVSVTTNAAAEPERAMAVNATGSGHVAAAAGRLGARLVAMSSDVVFDGSAAPYAEQALPHPVNAYGASKLAGEAAIVAEHPDPLIVRTTVLVGRDRAGRFPFSTYVLKNARAGRPIELYENERRNFYPVTVAAAALWECATARFTGILHLGATESASRFEFGRRLLEAAGLDPGLATPVAGPAGRPSDLTLTVDRAVQWLATPLPTMDEVIAAVSADLGSA